MSANYGDYPALYILELSYDGDRFVLCTESDVKVYEHLMMYLPHWQEILNTNK